MAKTIIFDGEAFMLYSVDDDTLKEFKEWMEKRGIEPNPAKPSPKNHLIFGVKNFKGFQLS
jgi:hypothetical protein